MLHLIMVDLTLQTSTKCTATIKHDKQTTVDLKIVGVVNEVETNVDNKDLLVITFFRLVRREFD